MAYHDEYVKLLSARLDGALTPGEESRLDAHLAQCPDCKALYDQLWVTAKAVKGLPPETPPADLTDRIMAAVAADNVIPITAAKKARQPWRRWLATAAVITLIVAGGYGMTQIRMGGAAKSAAPEAYNMAPTSLENAPQVGSESALAPALQPEPKAAQDHSAEVTQDNGNAVVGQGAPENAVTAYGGQPPQEAAGDSLPSDGMETLTIGSTESFDVADPSALESAQFSLSSVPKETRKALNPQPSQEVETMNTITVTVGGVSFSATLNDSPAAQTLREALPLTLDMSELNGNEKYIYLDFSLPADAQAVDQLHAGDLMLFGSNCLVLFYESFPTTYTYTPLGTLDDPAGLAQILGTGDVTVTFSAE